MKLILWRIDRIRKEYESKPVEHTASIDFKGRLVNEAGSFATGHGTATIFVDKACIRACARDRVSSVR